jgi:hypothetical protein
VKRNVILLVILIVVGIGLIVFGAKLVLGYYTATQPAPTASSTTVVPTRHTVKIVDGWISVGTLEDCVFSFTVDTATMSGVVVQGEFVVSGGLRNDITALVMDDISFTNWVNYHEVQSLYDSGPVTAAEFSVPITESDMYYLVFDNRFSVFKKTVNASITLEYLQ